MVLTLVTASASAERPLRVLPSRDLRIDYRISGALAGSLPGLTDGEGRPTALSLAWDVAGQRLRLEADGQSPVVIVDFPTRQASIEDPALGTALVLPMRASDVAALTLSQSRSTRQGHDTVLGYSCTLWAVQAARGSGTICVTDDGVALRGHGQVDGRQGGFVAISLTYAPQPASLFTVPPGYYRIEIPRFGPA